MYHSFHCYFGFALITLLVAACQPDSTPSTKQREPGTPAPVQVTVPLFNGDSAYAYVAKQVAFGPRVPGTDTHRACGDWLVAKLEEFGGEVIEQHAEVTIYTGQKVPMRNIIASWQPEKKERVLLFAHWDTRHVADQDTARTNEPIDGANDGASGVGVLLEIARILASDTPQVGIDIFFTDVEDMGEPHGAMAHGGGASMKTWCLGTQYWTKNPHVPNYQARFGILLDMVGDRDSKFAKEGWSMRYAPGVVNKVWKAAERAGYGHYFMNEVRNYVGVDDHVFVNEQLNIPSIDIVGYDAETRAFPPSWHTHADNMDRISKETLQAVGATVARVVWMEK